MPVLVNVMLAGLFGVMFGMDVMAVRDMRVVSGLVVVATFVVVRRRLMMLSGVLVMFSGFAVMLGSLFRHRIPSAMDDIGLELQPCDG